MREVIASGRTVEEATENGCRELGLSRAEVSLEILEMPVKKLFKSTPAKVKITANSTAPAEFEAPPAAAESPDARRPLPENAPQPAPVPGKPAPQLLPVEPEIPINLDEAPRVKQALQYLASIFQAMGADEVKMTAAAQGDATLLRVDSGQIAEKLEIRGEVVQALSYLIDRSVNAGVDKKEKDYLRVRLDIAGYRNRRESELMALAERTGKEVARTGRSRTLAPMNPYERLIVHTAISKLEGVASESIGSDVERRVVVKSTAPGATQGGDWRAPRREERPRGGPGRGGPNKSGPRRSDDAHGRRDGGRGGFQQRTSTPEREYADRPRDPLAAPVVPERRDAIRDGDDVPLYGKIEL